jgi:HAD superfamily phosphatase
LKSTLIFDMDGVLVDPTDSYRLTLIETVEHFSGVRIGHERILELKNEGGYNDDRDICERVLRDLGVEVELAEISLFFDTLFAGVEGDGRITRERWLVQEGTLQRLAENWRLAIYTGRARREAHFTLNRFATDVVFQPVITSDHVRNLKPAPDGLLLIRDSHPGVNLVYVGDTVDDARCARAAGIPFLGVAAPSAPFRERTLELFQQEGALAIVDSVNELPPVLSSLNGATAANTSDAI